MSENRDKPEEKGKFIKEPFPGGQVEPDENELRIAIEREPYAEIMRLAIENADVEVGGVLVGNFKEDKYGKYVHITHVIRAGETVHKANQFTFTHDSWNHIHKAMDSEHASRAIVGWFHTHPGYGVFLSEPDQFIHNNFFSQPQHTAYVYDPHDGSEGFFHLKNGELAKSVRYWLGPRERPLSGRPQDVAAPSTDTGDGPRMDALEKSLGVIQAELREQRRESRANSWLLTATCGLILVFMLIQMITTNSGCLRRPQEPTGRPIIIDPKTGDIYWWNSEPSGLNIKDLVKPSKEDPKKKKAPKKEPLGPEKP